MDQIRQVELEGTVPPWGITTISGFIQSALSRAERAGGDLPAAFHVSFCPWGERNAVSHNLGALADVFDARYRLVHFTSCGRPFLVAILIGDDAAGRQQKAMRYLPWSEHYRATRDGDCVTLHFVGEVQDVDAPEALAQRSLQQLFA